MSKNSEYLVQYSGLGLGLHTYEYEIGKSFFESLDYHEFEDCRIKVNLDLEKSASMLVLFFSINGTVKAQCDRCLEDMLMKLNGDFKQIIKISDYDESEDTDEVLILPSGEYEVDITKFIFDFVLLSVPAKQVHEVGECDEEAIERLNAYLVKDTNRDEDDEDWDEDDWEDDDIDDDDWEDETETEDDTEIDESKIDPRWKALMDLKNKEN